MTHTPHALHNRLGGAVGHVLDVMLAWTPEPTGPQHAHDVALQDRVRAHRAQDAAMAGRIAAGALTPPTCCHCPCHDGDVVS